MRAGLIQLSVAALAICSTAHAELPAAIAAAGETELVTWHAEGAQVYECKMSGDGKLAWTFREPVATLLFNGQTVGRHYAGPTWQHTDGSTVVGKVGGTAPGATAKDIPWLKLEVVARRGDGFLSGVTVVQRINTAGGRSEGPCEKAGAFHSQPYAADYVFLRKAP
jgi:hypothetical protein